MRDSDWGVRDLVSGSGVEVPLKGLRGTLAPDIRGDLTNFLYKESDPFSVQTGQAGMLLLNAPREIDLY